MKLTISGKLQLSFLSLAVLFIVSALFIYRSLETVEVKTTSLLTRDLPTVHAIQTSTMSVVKEIDKSKTLAGKGAAHTEQAYGTLNSTTTQIEMLNQQMQDLLTSAQSQSQATNEIQQLMNQVVESVDDVSNLSQSSAGVSKQVQNQVTALSEEMNRFRVQ